MHQKTNKWKILFLLLCVVVATAQFMINTYGSLFLYSILSDKIEQIRPLSVPNDLVFLTGFENTGREWPPEEEEWSEDLKQNPLTKLREAYCKRVGYRYADFGGDCFVFQYYDSFLTYTNEEEKFEVYYPYLWQRDFEPSHYQFMAEPKLLLNRRGASCALMYGAVEEDKILSLSDVSTSKVNLGNDIIGDTVPSTKGLDEITLPFGRELTHEEKAAGYTDAKLITVQHFPYATSPYGFLVTSGDEQPLVEACAQEFDSILDNRVINYPAAKLTPQSSGLVSLRNISSNFQINANDIPQEIVLIFENSATGREESIVPEAFRELHSYGEIYDPFLSEQKLYYIENQENNPKIKTTDIFTGESKTIPLPYDAAKPIHAFFVKDKMLYYLEGKFCNEYLAECKDMSLKSFDLESGVNETFTNNSKSRYIDGFNANGDALILSWKEGDAGCLWGAYESYTFSNKALADLGSYSWCEYGDDDPRDKFENLIVGTDKFYYLIIKDGKIFLPSTAEEYGGRFYIRVNTTEYPLDK